MRVRVGEGEMEQGRREIQNRVKGRTRGGEGRAEVTEVSSRQTTFNPIGRDLWLKAQRDLGSH